MGLVASVFKSVDNRETLYYHSRDHKYLEMLFGLLDLERSEDGGYVRPKEWHPLITLEGEMLDLYVRGFAKEGRWKAHTTPEPEGGFGLAAGPIIPGSKPLMPAEDISGNPKKSKPSDQNKVVATAVANE